MPQGFSDAAGWKPVPPDMPRRPAEPARPFASTGPHGHRGRMRQRLLDRGAAALADYEILEMLLFFGIARRDTKPLAKATINQFGSLAAVLGAPRATLLETPGLTVDCARTMALVQAAARRLARAETRAAPVLSDWQSLRAYLAGTAPVALRVLYLDSKNRLLADESADLDRLDALAVRGIMRRALEVMGVSLLLAAWRDDDEVTRADRAWLLELRAAGGQVAVGVHDFVLVFGNEIISVGQCL